MSNQDSEMSQDPASFNSIEEESMYSSPPVSQIQRNRERETLSDIGQIIYEELDSRINPPGSSIPPNPIEETQVNFLECLNSPGGGKRRKKKSLNKPLLKQYNFALEKGVPNDEPNPNDPPTSNPPPTNQPPPPPQNKDISGQEQANLLQPPSTSRVTPPQSSASFIRIDFLSSPFLSQILYQNEETWNKQTERQLVIVSVKGNAEWPSKSKPKSNEKNGEKAHEEGTLKDPIRKFTQPTPKKSRKIPIPVTSPEIESVQTAPPISPDLPIASAALPSPCVIEANELEVLSRTLQDLEQRLLDARVRVINESQGANEDYEKVAKKFQEIFKTYQFICSIYGEKADLPPRAISQPYLIYNVLPPMWRCIEEDLNFHLNLSAEQIETGNVDGFRDPDFPYFHDLIAHLFEKRGIALTSDQIYHNAEVLYKELIMELRRRRYEDGIILSELLELAGDARDPADSDPELLRKLEENDKLKKSLPTALNLSPRNKKSFKRRVQPMKLEDDPYNPDNIERCGDQTPTTSFEIRMLRKRSCSSSTEEKDAQKAKKKAAKKTVFFRGSECIALSDSEEEEEKMV